MRDPNGLDVTPLELDLIALFVTNCGQVSSRNQILARIWREQPTIENTSLNVHLHRLRDKIETDPSQPTRRQTVRGRGYVFVV
jgi:DNA-binding response OmpR family regulator